MKRKELAKTFIIFQIFKNLPSPWFIQKQVSLVRVKAAFGQLRRRRRYLLMCGGNHKRRYLLMCGGNHRRRYLLMCGGNLPGSNESQGGEIYDGMRIRD